ncbi:MAG TPA: BTAD domain-containing putative transcriptional regulator, partial [Gaiellaceae bacterium]|nr:BTAD domain-containing putative transcriptional regulator [Gaiellaceae bacterium]
MQFRILGPLEVVGDGGRPVELPRRKSRALLALLLLHANEVVSTSRLVDDLWGDEPPRTATASLQNAVSRLRSAIGAELVVSRPPGYQLRIDPGQIDLTRFEQLVEEAKSAGPEARAAKLREALSLWRGEPLADLANEPFAATEVGRLDELRTAATEEWIDAELDLGRHSELLGEIETMVARHPLRERPRGQLMRALYRAGRQADALEAYRETREFLVAALAVEPGEELQALQRAILTQDPALAAPKRSATPSLEAARKRVTALVVEVTVPGADPEWLRNAVERFSEDVRIAVERHGGGVHGAAGETLTALFGIPSAREDDAFRAVRAGQDVAALTVEGAEVRVAIDTGEAFVRGERVTGEAAANAQRLLEAARPGDVVLGAATLALVRNAVAAEKIEGARARGRTLDAFHLVSIEERA